jgi:hypothetical protein
MVRVHPLSGFFLLDMRMELQATEYHQDLSIQSSLT